MAYYELMIELLVIVSTVTAIRRRRKYNVV